MPGVKALRKIQLGKEATTDQGTAVAATALWRGMGTIEDTREITFPEEDIGYLSGIDRSYVAKLGAALSMDIVPATFQQLPYLLEAGIAEVTPVTDSGTGYIYTYTMPTTSQPTIGTYTIEGGDDQQAEEMEHAFVQSFTLSGKAGEALMMSAEWIGRQVVNSTFTGAIAVPAVEEILFSKGKLYLDPSTDTIATTQISNTLLSASLEVITGLIPYDTAEGNLYFSSYKAVMSEVLLTLVFEHTATAVTEKTNYRNEAARLLRLQFDGSALATTGTYATQVLRIDLAGKWDDFDKLDEQDGNDIIEATFRARYNGDAALYAQILIVNELTALL